MRIGLPCASRVRRGRLRARPCARSRRARILRAPLRASSAAPCDARRRERRRFMHESVHPCTASIQSFASPETCRMSNKCERLLLLLRQDAAQTGPPVARRGCGGKARRVARTMRASSLRAHGCALNEPRSTLAKSEGRMPGDRATGGVLSLVTFFAQAKKVTRSPAGRVGALLFGGRSRWIPACAGMTARAERPREVADPASPEERQRRRQL